MDLFKQYDAKTNYDLDTLANFQAVPIELRPLYTVTEAAKCNGITVGHSDELFTEYLPTAPTEQVLVHCAKPEYLRLSAARRLTQAAKQIQQLSKGEYALYLTDAYRPLTKQREQFNTIRAELSKTGLSGEALYRHTVQLISDPELLPPHATGGTVDITLCQAKTGQPLWLGTAVDAFDTKLIHTWHSAVPSAEQALRRLLYTAMAQAGFINFSLEWWHYSYGDLEWAMFTQQNTTLYSVVEQLSADLIVR